MAKEGRRLTYFRLIFVQDQVWCVLDKYNSILTANNGAVILGYWWFDQLNNYIYTKDQDGY